MPKRGMTASDVSASKGEKEEMVCFDAFSVWFHLKCMGIAI